MTYDYLILTEKPNVRRMFAKYFGGDSGTYHGSSYHLANLVGHVLSLNPPQEQADNAVFAKRLANWDDLSSIPWDYHHFKWTKSVNRGLNKVVNEIKRLSKDCNAIVIATDDDPSGEGDLLGWELINYINWHRPVYRMRFNDESEKAVLKAFDNKQLVTLQDGIYRRGVLRQRFDYLTMQLSRVATITARQHDLPAKVLRIGRLKSVVLAKIAEQQSAHDNYVKHTTYAVGWCDDAGRNYQLPDVDWQDDKQKVMTLVSQAKAQPVVDIKRQRKHSQPPQLFSLSQLSARLAPQGFSPHDVESTYQLMYEAHYVSYPRTEDKKITDEYYDDLIKAVMSVCHNFGLDTHLLTHLEHRPNFVANKVQHGANRLGSAIPKNWQEIDSKFGKCGHAIYDTLLRNGMALLCEDYVYDHVTAVLANKATWSTDVAVERNWRDVLYTSDEPVQTAKIPQIGTIAKPVLAEHVNARPSVPTQTMITNYLVRENVGTGATQLGVLVELTRKDGEVVNKRGNLLLTPLGQANVIFTKNTKLSSPQLTAQLNQLLDDVRDGKRTGDQIYQLLDSVVQNDQQIIAQNAQQPISDDIKTYFKKHGGFKMEHAERKEFTNNGVTHSYKLSFGNHNFTADEQAALETGQQIWFTTDSSYGERVVVGKLGEQTYNGKNYYGFGGKSFNRKWSSHRFTDDEIDRLINGEEISFMYTAKTGKEYEAVGKLESGEYNGKPTYGFKNHAFD